MPASGIDRVYLARRGCTALNVDGRLRGLSDKTSRRDGRRRVDFYDRKPR